ncbi:MAG: rRNA pseudouridine synthase [Clostridia bacterium]|nr:rRNA pseudouridine synthase [Clostridia bacterium]MBQ3938345.1 rRNA pseudouridine synthase [Clostridia bacterium]MBQ5488470.1 rRNA pseudouridine synthase [Clostridia bacterium]
MRLQKYLADAGIASRRKCEELIAAGRVSVNGTVARLGATFEEGDEVLLDGRPVAPQREKVIILFNKPKNVICTNDEGEDRVRVSDFFTQLPYRLYTVGRLDYDSEGLILVTNDGDTANRLMHPRYGTSKTYRVLCTGWLTPEDKRRLRSGVELEDGMTSPAELRILRERQDGRTELLLTIHEGKNRQVRRMLAATGHDTLRLQRTAIGKLELGDLKPGEWRYITEDELEKLTQ